MSNKRRRSTQIDDDSTLPNLLTFDKNTSQHNQHITEAFSQKHKFSTTNTRPRKFLNDVSFSIPLNELMYVKDFCYNNQKHTHVPILTHIKKLDLIPEQDQRMYLLQVWSNKGKVLFEMHLQDEEKFIYILKLDGNRLIKVRDLWQFDQDHENDEKDPSAESNSKRIYMVKIEPQLINAKTGIFDITKDKVRCLKLNPTGEIRNLTFHGFIENQEMQSQKDKILCLIELEDNQMSFQTLQYDTVQKKFELEFYKDIQLRNSPQFQDCEERDEIKSFLYHIDQHDCLYGVAIRKSGMADIYYNYYLCSSSTSNLFLINNLLDKFQKAIITKQEIVLMQIQEQKLGPGGLILLVESLKEYKLRFKFKSRIGFDVAETNQYSGDVWTIYQHLNIANFINQFNSMTMIGILYIVSFDTFVGIFDLQKRNWVKFENFNRKVKKVMRCVQKNKEWNLVVFLRNKNSTSSICYYNADRKVEKCNILHKEDEFQIKSIITEWYNQQRIYFISMRGEQIQLKIIQNMKIEIINLNGFQLSQKHQLVKLISKENQQDNKYEDFVIFDKEIQQIYFFNKVEGMSNTFKMISSLKISFQSDENTNIQVNKITAIMKIQVPNRIILFDDKNGYILNSKSDVKHRIIQNIQVANVLLLDQKYLYSIINSSEKYEQGVYFQSLASFMDEDVVIQESGSFKLKSAIAGRSCYLEYFKKDQRIVYQSDFQTIKIVPILHRNIISFFGMKKRSKYLGFKSIGEDLIGLDYSGKLTSWNRFNGMLNTQLVIGSFDSKFDDDSNISKFSVFGSDIKEMQPSQRENIDENFVAKGRSTTYMKDWHSDALLLVNYTQEIKNVDEREFFGSRYFTGGANQITKAFIKTQPKKFYEFKVIEIISKSEFREHYNFIHPIFKNSDYTKIHISKNREKMFEKVDEFSVFLYNKIGNDLDENNLRIKWNLIRRIYDFPHDISKFSDYNYLLSPNFKYYLDFDISKNFYKIVSLDQSKSLDSYNQFELNYYLDQGIINPHRDDPTQIAKKFMWINDYTFKVINNFGYEKIIQFNNDEQTVTFQKQQMILSDVGKQIGYCKIPMLDLKKINDTKHYHYYLDYNVQNTDDIEERLMIKYQRYFSAVNERLSQKDEHKESKFLTSDEFDELMYTIDYSQNNCQDRPIIDMSFTYLHWKIVERIESDQIGLDFLKKLPIKDIRLLCLNIFPEGQTILHVLFNNITILQELYSIIREDNNRKQQELVGIYGHASNYIKFNIPFILNYKKLSPLHLCLRLNRKGHLNQQQNEQAADVFLSLIKDDDIDNHSRAIVDILPNLVELELPRMGIYLESRIVRTDILDTLNRGSLNHRKGVNYAIETCLQWPDKKQLTNQIFKKSRIENEIRVEMLDIPHIHDLFTHECVNFAEAISKVEDIQIFNNKAIMCLIDFMWPIAKRQTIKYLFVPFLVYLALFVSYSNVLCGQVEQNYHIYDAKIVIIALLYVMSIYLLINEVRQVYKLKLNYFRSIWNYSDISPPILVIIVISFHLRHHVDNSYELPSFIITLHSFASLLVWIKFLYFLRIFRTTGYLINMLSTVLWDMKIFLLILLIIYLGFAEAFLRLAESSEEEFNFAKNYAYALVYAFRLSIGDTDTDLFDDNKQPITIWIIFILCALYTNIVMLNLLIAIISQSFEKINNNANQASYQERSRIIFENNYLISKGLKKNFCERNSYLVTARIIDAQKSAQELEEFNQEKNSQNLENTQNVNQQNIFPNSPIRQSQSPDLKLVRMPTVSVNFNFFNFIEIKYRSCS
ncbi:wd-40 repeat protein [Stylonychia lemnae]|uniref:Wd-40 repeat protein n=1 Tax=Stylonychia lemnae TaxID=5949 RepID=A0A078B0C2_STYLE|nr:wd-40 repeat protein [Stylonychia lemnae]|eukprot:CDW87954.1 wd-40 repeat protein [Stylonychia lemnae]